MSKSWYILERGWMDHPAFGKEPYTKREAWLWMVEHAVYDSYEVISSVTGKVIKLERGELCYTQAYMAKAWKWSTTKRVRRLIKELEKEPQKCPGVCPSGCPGARPDRDWET